jgi:hypothetical protein
MQNLNTTHRDEIREGEICVPVRGARTSFIDVRDIGAAAARVRGVPFPFVLVMVLLYTTTRFGMADRVTPDLERLLGRPSMAVRQYIEDYQSAWQ